MRAHVAHAGPEDAPPLVALHGFPQHWYSGAGDPAAGRRLPDPGHGHARARLERPGADGDYRKARIAEDAVALLDALGIERAGPGRPRLGRLGGLARRRCGAPERWTGYVADRRRPPVAAAERCCGRSRAWPISRRSAAPMLGPRLIPRHRPGDPPGGLGRPLDVRRRRRGDVRRHLPRPARRGRQPLLPRLPHPRAARVGQRRGSTGRAWPCRRGCCSAPATRSDRDGRRPGAPRRGRAHEYLRRAAGTSCPRSGRGCGGDDPKVCGTYSSRSPLKNGRSDRGDAAVDASGRTR